MLKYYKINKLKMSIFKWEGRLQFGLEVQVVPGFLGFRDHPGDIKVWALDYNKASLSVVYAESLSLYAQIADLLSMIR